ncbi:MAG: hypothetical protein AAB864_01460 [Patescibacteria group bacterium]
MTHRGDEFKKNLTALWYLLSRLPDHVLRTLRDAPIDKPLSELPTPIATEDRFLLEQFWTEPVTKELVRLAVQEELTGRAQKARSSKTPTIH